MYAIASLLDPAADETVRALWKRFETQCGLTGIQKAPLPHFSWMGAEGFALEEAGAALEALSGAAQPFSVYATGLGIFTGARPVVYIPLVKNAELLDLHGQVWDRLCPTARQLNGYYAPPRWMPHITLAFHEFDPDRLACAVEDISFQTISFRVQVNHFAIIYANNGEAGVERVFPFWASTGRG